ncbi:Oxalate decarboxylase OxdC [Fulvia fulva]|uniref:Oxalate decarboxylase OxdC n=1 Tax=Passalora fulva TaxID=5499 RepID=A0A9Q8PJ73_PASFU|nr:Oxalate decarboxylase OxdC [Fulvia fulva]KAK4612272.1 Oxalate decarboxylase OxdC [Fulvia fulva]UJO23490.1 Oxalate decarboxylase OxdC [Fulvia fulva]WPV21185.1 Oxalate decarboxylase OxdC [Fulvia fulva]WPV36548.1 Oxalate decarboxylase OxdC [Fulvia fulva]
MHISRVFPVLTLAASCLAAPAQHPLVHGRNPYQKNFNHPYDHKVDSIGRGIQPEPMRNGHGTDVLGPRNRDRERQNPDMIRPPSTDHDSHVRIEEGGWTRQTTVKELPTSVELAGVNMRLDEGVIRELHWHKDAEWAYVLEGKVRVTALDTEGGSFIDDVEKGDLWYFPAGHPHSLQALAPNGTEFLLIFDDGSFSEESTFLLTDWLAHTPQAVVAENFRLPPDVFDTLPESEKYIFQGSLPDSIEKETPKTFKKSKHNFTHRMLAQEPVNATGGSVRITDSKNFPISKTVAAAHLDIEPGAMREMHWHPNADEWSFFIKGRARVTIFGAQGTARTFDYTAGDVGIVPKNMGHFIENLSEEEPLEVLELFRADEFQDFSLFQWLGETPQRNVRDHLFKNDPDGAAKFAKAIETAEKDVIKSQYEKPDYVSEGLQSVLGV